MGQEQPPDTILGFLLGNPPPLSTQKNLRFSWEPALSPSLDKGGEIEEEGRQPLLDTPIFTHQIWGNSKYRYLNSKQYQSTNDQNPKEHNHPLILLRG